MKYLLTSMILLFAFTLTAQKKSEAKTITIPFDSTTEKYTYKRIVEVPGKSAIQLYQAAKEWSKQKFADDKFLLNEENSKLIDRGNFSINVKIINAPITYTVTYSIDVQVKDGKSKIEVTNIKLSENADATTKEQTLESFKTQMESMGMGKKLAEYLVLDCFEQIDIKMQKILAELEAALKGEGIKKDDW